MTERKTEKKKTAGKYLIFGILNTLIKYGIYEALVLLFFSGEQLWISSLISGVIALFVGYYLHSRFTWKDRKVGKKQLMRFFIWNVILNLAIAPLLTKFFGLFGFLYQFAQSIFQGIGINLDYDFVESTGVFVLVMVVEMVINFLVYDKFVFGETKHDEKKDEESKED
ncbi:GtrA family protein [Candidatus Saccharibacteria bacterium]|nr:GtrA family protein [Candidatus Saccharibacteria bacterium]